jgi:microcystin-dependent protein
MAVTPPNLPYPENESVAGLFSWGRNLIQALQSWINDMGSNTGGQPTGSILATVGDVPAGYLPMEGQILKRTEHPGLFRVIGTRWNTGDVPPDSFRLPDARGRVPRMDEATYGGRDQHVLTRDDLPQFSLDVTDPGHDHEFNPAAHNHQLHDPAHAHGVNAAPLVQGGTTAPGGQTGGVPGVMITDQAQTGISIDSAYADGTISVETTGIQVHTGGKSTAINLQPSFFGVTWCIKS